MLRVLGDRPVPAVDEHDDTGMDAPPDSDDDDRDAGRSRLAPAFCRPKPVSPKPYREATPSVATREEAVPRPPIRWREVLGKTPVAEQRPAVVATEALPRELPSPPAYEQVRPGASDRELRRSTEAVRPIWDDSVDEESEAGAVAATEEGFAWTGLGRGVALLLGTLLGVDLFSSSGLPAGGPWWLDTRPLPETASALLLGVSCAALLAFAARGALPRPVRFVAMICAGVLIAISLKNATVYYGLLRRGDLHAGPPVAFPLHIAACLGVVLLSLRASPGPRGVPGMLLVLIGFNAALVALPVAHLACCGSIDARTPAAAAIVFGSRPFEGEEQLEARLRTAEELHRSGMAPKIVLLSSGEELARMKELAMKAGVPESVVEAIDPEAEAFSALRAKFPRQNGKHPTLLAVSDADHLPRVVVSARAAGLTLWPVPAASNGPTDRKTVMREILALWRFYLRR